MNHIVFDLEATCWESESEASGKRREIIEIGAVMINDDGKILSRFESFVKPILHPTLSEFCKRLTSISQIDINQADEFVEVIEDFKDWIGFYDHEEYILCSWGFYDKSALKKDCILHDLDNEWVNAHISLKDQYPRIKNTGRAVGLKKAVESEGFDFEGTAHRALTDAENTAKIFIKYLNLWRF